MPKYIINREYSSPETVEADGYQTNGDFIDFTRWNGEDTDTVLRIRSAQVQTIHLEAE